MQYTIYELIWFYYIYSFIGWAAEVAAAAYKRHTFVNRGFVSGPLCPIYGAGAVAVAVFLPELAHRLVFLFLGGMIITTFIEYLTGRVMEKMFQHKWWDYSNKRFQLDGYICLKNSVLWGVCSVVMICFADPLLCEGILWLPRWIGEILLWILSGLLLIDYIGSGLAILGLKKKNGKIEQITSELKKTSKVIENAMTRQLQKRMVKAFPNISQEDAACREKHVPAVFAEGCGFYKLISLFFIGAFLGDIVETIFCLITTGRLMSRSSVVYGPFSLVWGIACALLTWILYRYRDKSDRYIFVFGTFLGGAYEYICSVFTELVFGTVFWDYSKIPFNLGGRINLLYCFFWGIAAVVWMKGIYPKLSQWIEKLPMKMGKVLSICMIAFMSVNIVISALALDRYTERQTAESAETAVSDFFDEHFPDDRMEKIYPNIILTE
ncbi:putative ABC transporter permease [Mediterraneibacter sp. ICN-202921]|uniref:putative ABC transporter permease n=1 Tax=Mediterraneibacter sp. ICN-202921 TaxID=3134657 RepID=UPI000E555401|nr:hypothetical protein DWX08_12135 [Ruminococcus sp. AF18-22]